MMTTFGCFIVFLATCCTEAHITTDSQCFMGAVTLVCPSPLTRAFSSMDDLDGGQENTSYASVVAAEGSQIVLSCGVADDSERRRVQRIECATAHSGVCTQPGTVAMKTYRISDG